MREENPGDAEVKLIQSPGVQPERIRVGGPDKQGTLRRLERSAGEEAKRWGEVGWS